MRTAAAESNQRKDHELHRRAGDGIARWLHAPPYPRQHQDKKRCRENRQQRRRSHTIFTIHNAQTSVHTHWSVPRVAVPENTRESEEHSRVHREPSIQEDTSRAKVPPNERTHGEAQSQLHTQTYTLASSTFQKSDPSQEFAAIHQFRAVERECERPAPCIRQRCWRLHGHHETCQQLGNHNALWPITGLTHLDSKYRRNYQKRWITKDWVMM